MGDYTSKLSYKEFKKEYIKKNGYTHFTFYNYFIKDHLRKIYIITDIVGFILFFLPLYPFIGVLAASIVSIVLLLICITLALISSGYVKYFINRRCNIDEEVKSAYGVYIKS